MTRSQKPLMILGALLIVPEPSSLAIAQLSQQREAQRQHAQVLAWRRDPFTRGAATGELSGLQLSGIIWDAQNPLAIINGGTVRVGDEVGGYYVVEITPDHVAVSDGAQTLDLRLAP